MFGPHQSPLAELCTTSAALVASQQPVKSLALERISSFTLVSQQRFAGCQKQNHI